MLKLNLYKSQSLSGTIIKTLAQNRILTILDFLSEDAEKLSIITKLNLPQIIEIRRDIYTKYAAPLQCGKDLSDENKSLSKFIYTGITSLDSILDGGIPVGYITEILGLPGSGKSQLCMQIAVNAAKTSYNTVLYIDTKGDCSAVRIQQLLYLSGLSHKDIAIIMVKIKIIFVWNLEDLIDLMQELKYGNLKIENLSLIIIDSLPCLLFQHSGDDNKVGYTNLNILVNLLRFLCKKKHLSVLCVNIQTRWINYEVTGDPHAFGTSSNQETLIRCLGKYWKHIPYLVINLEKRHHSISEDSKTFECYVKIYICNIAELQRSCTLKIGCTGIC